MVFPSYSKYHNKVDHIGMGSRLQQLTYHEQPLDSAFSEGDLNHPIVFLSASVKTRTCNIPFCRACAWSKTTKQPLTILLRKWLFFKMICVLGIASLSTNMLFHFVGVVITQPVKRGIMSSTVAVCLRLISTPLGILPSAIRLH